MWKEEGEQFLGSLYIYALYIDASVVNITLSWLQWCGQCSLLHAYSDVSSKTLGQSGYHTQTGQFRRLAPYCTFLIGQFSSRTVVFRVKLVSWIHGCTPSVAVPVYVCWNFAGRRRIRMDRESMIMMTGKKAI